MVVGLLGNESPDLNRFILVNPKSENDVRLQATIGNQNPTGLPVGAVRCKEKNIASHCRHCMDDSSNFVIYILQKTP